jgi:hypothetical protein
MRVTSPAHRFAKLAILTMVLMLASGSSWAQTNYMLFHRISSDSCLQMYVSIPMTGYPIISTSTVVNTDSATFAVYTISPATINDSLQILGPTGTALWSLPFDGNNPPLQIATSGGVGGQLGCSCACSQSINRGPDGRIRGFICNQDCPQGSCNITTGEVPDGVSTAYVVLSSDHIIYNGILY